jgi:hypothetical protein
MILTGGNSGASSVGVNSGETGIGMDDVAMRALLSR